MENSGEKNITEEKIADIKVEDGFSLFENIVFFLIPPSGILMYAIHRFNYPEKAKEALNISFAGIIIVAILGYVFFFAK